MEVIAEIFAVFFWRIILGGIGASVRYIYLILIGNKKPFSNLYRDKDRFAADFMSKETTKSAIVAIIFIFSIYIAVQTIIKYS